MRRVRLSSALAGLLLAGLSPALSGAAPSIAQADPADRPLWLRHPAVSPDGQHIAFVYGGQIWRVPAGHGGVGSGWSFPFRRSTRPGQDKLDQLSNWINV